MTYSEPLDNTLFYCFCIFCFREKRQYGGSQIPYFFISSLVSGAVTSIESEPEEY